jgi:hypothetical protein
VLGGLVEVAAQLQASGDRDGRLRWSQAGDRHMTRSGAEILRVLVLIRKLREAG